MLFLEIPADLNALSAAELRALAAEIRTARAAVKAMASTASIEDIQKALELGALRSEKILPLAAAKDALAADTDDDEGDEKPAEPTTTQPVVEPPTPQAPEPTAVPGGENDPGDTGGSASGGGGVALATTTGQRTVTAPAPKGTRVFDYLTAADGVDGKKAGEGFASWSELAEAVYDRGQSINANTADKFTVGVVKANYPPERILSGEAQLNMSKFEPDELTAALCAPATPYYDMHCMNTLRRPVFNGLPQFQAPRMKVSIYPSPQLSDITTGFGVWTSTNEASTNNTKSPCQTIVCGNPVEYQAYGVYRCMTIRNMLAMSFPELVEAYLNRLAAAQARLAEQTLLNAMGTAAIAVAGPALGYGATTSIISTLLNYLMLFQEQQRWDLTDNFDCWGHRWILQAMKMDLFRRRTTNGEVQKVATDAQINQMFANAGFNVHWFIDNPTWAEPIPAVVVGGALRLPPSNVNFLVHAPGKFGLIDRGELKIGVTGNGIYRDNNSNNRNEFTFFMENFEGIVDTGACGAHIITLPVCFNGVQIDDLGIGCQGQDVTSNHYQS